MSTGALIAPPVALPAASVAQPSSAIVHSRILIVDDEPSTCDILSQGLRGAGFRVDCAADGQAGWDALCMENFDVLIMDYAMPRLTGLDLLRQVQTRRRDLPVNVIAREMPWDGRNFLPLLSPGLAVEQPFSLAQLAVKIRALLTASPV